MKPVEQQILDALRELARELDQIDARLERYLERIDRHLARIAGALERR